MITVLPGNWGEANVNDILRVLVSAAEEFEAFFPEHDAFPMILVSKSSEDFLRTLSERGPNGEIQVTLSVEGRKWAKFAYQLGHELCHIFCDSATVDYAHPNLWFEQTICEVASLFVLGRMAETWKTRAPYPNWTDYAPALREYRDQRTEEARLCEGKSLADLLREQEESLRRGSMHDLSPTSEAHILTMAPPILPIFDDAPQHWEAVGYLNTTRDASRTFEQYLRAWSTSSPEKHREFIRQIAELFGVSL